MDFNQVLLSAMLIRGRFDGTTIHESKFRVYMSYFLVILQLFCGLKMLVVVVMPWDDEAPLLFYLIDFYIFPGGVQRILHAAVACIHVHIAYIYWKWVQVSADKKQMHHLQMLFMPDFKKLLKHYHLPRKETRKFLQRVNVYKKMTSVFAVVFELFFALLVGRCLYSGYITIPISHFVFISIPMGIITLFSYHWLANGFLVSNQLALVTISFLELRINTLSDRIKSQFRMNVGRPYRQIKLLDKQDKSKLLDIISTMNDIVEQYKEVNMIFNRLISPTFVCCLAGALIYPSFLFLDFSYFFKLISIFCTSG